MMNDLGHEVCLYAGGGGSRAVSGTFGGSTGDSGIVIVRYVK